MVDFLLDPCIIFSKSSVEIDDCFLVGGPIGQRTFRCEEPNEQIVKEKKKDGDDYEISFFMLRRFRLGGCFVQSCSLLVINVRCCDCFVDNCLFLDFGYARLRLLKHGLGLSIIL